MKNFTSNLLLLAIYVLARSAWLWALTLVVCVAGYSAYIEFSLTMSTVVSVLAANDWLAYRRAYQRGIRDVLSVPVLERQVLCATIDNRELGKFLVYPSKIQHNDVISSDVMLFPNRNPSSETE